jgi:hypothetical protein
MNSVVADKQDVGLLSLPPEIFASVLSLFCNGKSISTFLLASQASNSFDGFETVQGALVERYERLSQRVADENVRDTLDLLIQQLLTCERDSPAAMKLFSERCAVLDYFEAHLEFGHHWLIWCGEFERCVIKNIQEILSARQSSKLCLASTEGSEPISLHRTGQ